MEPIAIIGIGCRFPFAENPEEYWHLLSNGIDGIKEVPSNRWDTKLLYSERPVTPGKMNTKWGGFLEQVDGFDAEFFGISPREAEYIDPQQRLLLEVSWEALENGGIIPQTLASSQTGVFVGISNNDYARLTLPNISEISAYSGTGNALCIAANRLSYFLNLKGPSFAIDTACSSSLVAVHYACQSLRLQESELCLAGGVNLILSPEFSITFSQARMMASDGRCKTFDAKADGYVR
ncbi:MAG: beta-ketoacyl synthase N-terminal-like domain-containing protein, partial [Crocosphaera sp.]